MNATMEPEMNVASATTTAAFNRRTNSTNTSKSKSSISLEGQDFDISNLLSNLPSDCAIKNTPTTSSKDEKYTKRRINARSSLIGVSYPTISSKHSVHHVRPSFLASTNALAGFLPDSAPQEPVQHSTGGSEHQPRRGSNITSISRLSMMSNISALSDSFAFEDGCFMADDHYTNAGVTDMPSELPKTVTSFFAASNDMTDLEYQHIMSLAGDDTEPQNQVQEIEVAPDVYLPFRSSEETWNTIKMGNSSDLTCVHCSLDQVVANDCAHVICPECHTINRNPATQRLATLKNDAHPIMGVSMGFRNEWCGGY